MGITWRAIRLSAVLGLFQQHATDSREILSTKRVARCTQHFIPSMTHSESETKNATILHLCAVGASTSVACSVPRTKYCERSVRRWRVLRSTSAVFLRLRSLKSVRSQLGGRLLGSARVCGSHDEQFGVLPVQKPGGVGEHGHRMFKQACLCFVQRRRSLLWRARHGEVGVAVKVAPHRLVCRRQAQPLPFLRPPECGRGELTPSDTHTPRRCKKSASSVGRRGLGKSSVNALCG